MVWQRPSEFAGLRVDVKKDLMLAEDIHIVWIDEVEIVAYSSAT